VSRGSNFSSAVLRGLKSPSVDHTICLVEKSLFVQPGEYNHGRSGMLKHH